ncbi:hypothetical protein [Streptomyces sp. NBC_00354]|uniref:hypothetical protein n=1 Tax=Streptomyces sp. NBC_00354 TaxID=2975723 RepID=UPI002E25E5DC
MFIRPIGVRVEAARRPSGRPLLRGLLSRAAGLPQPASRQARPPEAGAEPAEPGMEPGAEPGALAGGEPGAGALAGGPTTEPGAPPGGLAAELAELARLAREGLLTPQEFKEAKTRLLHP